MCKSELYRQILGTVSQETEISEERILSKAKNAEIVDARYLLVYFLWRQGFHAPVISSLMNFSRRPIIHVDFCIVSSTAASAERTQQCKSLKQ